MTSIRLALRQLAKTPGFTITALATLALCLGANLTIFAVVDAILVRSLPLPEPERLVTLINSYPNAGVERAAASLPNYYDRRGAMPAFASLSNYQEGSVIVGGDGAPRRVPNARVTPDFFTTLGVPLAIGQSFNDDQVIYGTDEVAVLTDGFWRSQFNADPAVIGKTFLNDGITITIVGVLPPGFRFLESRAQFYRPLSHALQDRQPNSRHANNSAMIARLAPGATLAEARAQMDAFNAQQATDDPFIDIIKGSGYHTMVLALHEDHVRTWKPILVLLQIGVLFLLLIGTVNLANLLLIRASGRTKELAVRQALGARGRHIARDVLVETVLLALGGGLLGLLLGQFGIELLGLLGAEKLPLGTAIEFNLRVASFSLVGALVVGVLLAGPIIWFNLHSKLAPSLQAETRGGTASRGAQMLRNIFIVTQVALAFVLLSGAGLLGISLKRVMETPVGFNPDSILTGQIALPWKNYQDDASRTAFIDRLLPALRALPGVTHAAITTGLPFSGGSSNNATIVEGYDYKAGENVRAHYTLAASSEYWPLLGIPLVRGRLLTDTDNQTPGQRVCVVDQAFADRYWPGADPLGRRIAPDPVFTEEKATTVVGVVASVKQNEISESDGYGAIYFPYRAFNPNGFTLVVRTALPPASLAASVQKAVQQLDPGLPVEDLRTMRTRIDDSLIARRSPAILAGIFAAVALLLAAIGTYGVLAYAVSQRRREIGVRMALGALPQQILAQFLRLGAALLLIGIALGVPFAWLAGYLMQSQLFGIGTMHLGVLVSVAGVMLVVVLLAVLLPSRRAARINPLDALRDE